MNSWDTIVIGAGIGGLTAAATLVHAGKNVLVLEKSPHAGGTAYVYRRNGFTFPMGPLGFSNPGTIVEKLKELNQHSNFSCERVHYCLRAFNLDLMLSLPFPDITRELTSHFPDEAAGIQQFFRDIEEFIRSSLVSSSTSGSAVLSRFHSMSMEEYLNTITNDQRLQCILGSLGTRNPYTSFPLQAAMWNIMGNEGIWYPRGGFTSFCNRLAEAVTGQFHKNEGAASGVIKLGTEVKRIVVEGNRVIGVILTNGNLIRSTSVISNADFKSTFLKLLEPDVAPDWQSAISRAKQAGSIVQVCLGVDSAKVDLSAFNKASRIIYRCDQSSAPEETDIQWHNEEVTEETFAKQEIEVSCWSEDDGNLAPPGRSVIILRVEAPYEHFTRFRLGWRARAPIYAQHKMSIARVLINEVKSLLPGLEQNIITTDIATPITFEDQGGRSQGAVAGWSWNYEDNHTGKLDELITTPVRGLYMAGYQAFSALFMGGIPTAMESGSRAARAALQQADPTNDIRIPGV
jgi:all-trans-retinol 13,14-reductase